MKTQKKSQNIEQKSVNEMLKSSQNYVSIQNIDSSIPQYYEPDASGKNMFYPTLMSKSTVHFYNQRRAIDEEKMLIFSLELNEKQQNIRWEDAKEEAIDFEAFPHKAPSKMQRQALPKEILEDKGLKGMIRELKEYLYQEEKLELLRCSSAKLESKPGESRSDFIVRLQDSLNDKKELAIEKLKTRYASKEKVLTQRLSRAKDRVEKESSDSTSSMIDAGIAVIGALFGRKSPASIGRAFRKGSGILKERGDMSRAEERVTQVNESIEALEYELEDKVDLLTEKYSADNCKIETFMIKPRKTDIEVENCALVWRVS
jgi:hypothetical protein